MKSADPLEVVGEFGAQVDARTEAFLKRNAYAMYGMMRYFMGYADEQFKDARHPVGKRFRPGLLLLIADAYGMTDEALPVALSIELYHNFTLIHDDVVDHDELRRGRPTVWKLWGVDHAINTGDAQLLLALRALEDIKGVPAERTARLRARLLDLYLEVIEGQYLDFTLAAAKLVDGSVSEEAYLAMLQKKTARLVRAATEAAPMLAGRSEEEIAALGDFGDHLGMAYQLYDDWQSIWGDPAKTGKKRAGDIYERKKTLPVIYARDHLEPADLARLEALYDETIDESGVEEVLKLFTKIGADTELEARAAKYKEAAIEALARTLLPSGAKTTLEQIARALVPDVITASR
jgi:geranylgeranyl diphosphate synthase type I